MPKVRTGGKITRSHCTVTKTSCAVVESAINLQEVSKVSIGYLENIGGSNRSLKFGQIIGGILAKVRGDGGIQLLYIYTSDPEKTKRQLLEAFTRVS